MGTRLKVFIVLIIFVILTVAFSNSYSTVNIDNINTRDFVKQFKDKEFVTNLAYTTGEAINIIADKWRKRNFATLKESNEKTKAKLEEEKIRSVLLNSSMTSKQIKELDDLIKS